jgi:signal transduction histidine kinase
VLFALAAFGALLADPLLLHKVTGLPPAMWALSFLAAVPLVARRRFPLAVLAAEVPLLVACLAVAHPNRAAVGIAMLLVFTVGLEGGRTRSLVVGALMALLVTAAIFITGQRAESSDVIAYVSLVLGALLAGEALRARQALARTLAEEAARAREAAARHRFDADRLTLANELHDVVGHTLVAINVRAAAAARRAQGRCRRGHRAGRHSVCVGRGARRAADHAEGAARRARRAGSPASGPGPGRPGRPHRRRRGGRAFRPARNGGSPG